VRDPYADRDALLISVFMNVFNVHSNRASVDGRVMRVQYFPGLFVNADLDKASTDNERNAVVIDAQGRTVTLVQVAGLIARRILCYVKEGDVLERGQRYGFIRFGSRVDVYLPPDATPRVAPGDTVRATSTILALFATT
jgi:phosphatidylserine decarboxylase